MKFYVVELGSGRQPLEVTVDPVASREWQVALSVLVPRQTRPADLSNLLKEDLAAQELISAEVIFMRVHYRDYLALMADRKALREVQGKLTGRETHILTYGAGAFDWFAVSDASPSIGERLELQARLCTVEMRHLIALDGVIMPPSDSFHYEGPNGDVYRQFIRFASALRSVNALDSVAFWLSPLCEDRPLVIVDSATIAAVGLHLDRYRLDCLGETTRLAGFECVGAYGEDPQMLKDRLIAMPLGDPTQRAEVSTLVVRSVVSTGKLTSRVTRICAEAGLKHVSTVAFYGSPDAEGDVFCRLEDLKEESGIPPGATIPISGTDYFPELTTAPELCKINQKTAEMAYEFFDAYRSEEVVAVHRDDPSGTRHHAVYVDIAELCESETFRERVALTLAGIHDPSSIDLILSPEHVGARAMSELVGRSLDELTGSSTKVPRVRCDPEMLYRARDADKARLNEARRILLVDDALVTGARLKSYRHFLRACDYHRDDSPIGLEFMVGLSRPEDNNNLKHLTDMVHGADHFHYVEQLILPNWDKEECPWCVELRSMESHASRVLEASGSSRFQVRLDELRDTGHGLRTNIFLPWGERDDQLPHSSRELGPESIFHAETEAELFAAVASAIQALRQQRRLTKRLALPIAKVLDPRFWLAGRYYDSVLTAAILRATRRHDVRNAHLRDDLLEYTSQYLTEEFAKGIRGEILLAVARGHLPAPSVALASALGDLTADPGVRNWMKLANG